MSKVVLKNDYVTKTQFNTGVNELKSDINILKKAVLRIEERLGYFGDMYEINKWHAEKLANRVNVLEKHNGITPPQDLLISGI